jgi:hypothetical protein
MVIDDILIRKFRAPVYGSMVWIVVCDNIHKAIDAIEDMTHLRIAKEKDKPYIEAYTYANVDKTYKCHIILFVTPQAKPGAIGHECKHAVNFLFWYHDVKLSLTNDQPECYYLENFIDRVHDAVKYYGKKVL